MNKDQVREALEAGIRATRTAMATVECASAFPPGHAFEGRELQWHAEARAFLALADTALSALAAAPEVERVRVLADANNAGHEALSTLIGRAQLHGMSSFDRERAALETMRSAAETTGTCEVTAAMFATLTPESAAPAVNPELTTPAASGEAKCGPACSEADGGCYHATPEPAAPSGEKRQAAPGELPGSDSTEPPRDAGPARTNERRSTTRPESTTAAPSGEAKDPGCATGLVCEAARDEAAKSSSGRGVICADDECDYADGIRKRPAQPAPTPEAAQAPTREVECRCLSRGPCLIHERLPVLTEADRADLRANGDEYMRANAAQQKRDEALSALAAKDADLAKVREERDDLREGLRLSRDAVRSEELTGIGVYRRIAGREVDARDAAEQRIAEALKYINLVTGPPADYRPHAAELRRILSALAGESGGGK